MLNSDNEPVRGFASKRQGPDGKSGRVGFNIILDLSLSKNGNRNLSPWKLSLIHAIYCWLQSSSKVFILTISLYFVYLCTRFTS